MRDFRLWILFILLIATAFIGIFLLTGLFALLGMRLGFIPSAEPVLWVPLIGLGITAALVAFGFTLLVSKSIFTPVHELIQALKVVADGNFHVQLPEDSNWKDIQEMNINFNRMVKELNSITLLQSDFIQSVSHEIKTPLAAIEGYATLLTASELSGEQKEYSARILESSQRLSALTGNILKLSKLENQQIVPEKKRYLLDEQIRQCILSMEPLWSSKNLELDVDLQETEYWGSEELLAQVWINLLSNAVKYTPEGGTIAVQLLKVNKDIQVTFRDTGIGMSEEVQKHIFDKFYQADSSRSNSGNGLGLALVNRILTLCGGQIFVKSQPGKGSLFVIHLLDHKGPAG